MAHLAGRLLGLRYTAFMPARWVGGYLGFAVLAAALSDGAATAPSLPEAIEEASRTITVDDLRAHIRFLASDELQGRGTASPGNQVAELYLASTFERLRLGRATGPGYLQPFDVYFSKLGGNNALTISEHVNTADVETRYAPGADFYPHPVSAARAVSAGLAFAGYGITAPEYQYDDYAGLDAKGRIVVALDGEPQSDDEHSRFLGRASTPYSGVDQKIEMAREHGAVGLLLVRSRVRDVKSVWPDHPSIRARHLQLVERVDRATLPVAVISTSAAGTLLGTPASNLKSTIDQRVGAAGSKPVTATASFVINERQARLSVDLSRERLVVHNVVGMIEGTDPQLKQQVVVVGAHMDHDGVDDDGRVFNGADDNASGTAGVLVLAEAFAAAAHAGHPPARTVVFALWNGEEKGDLGSEYYVGHPAPAGRLVANVNMDMVGRNEEVPDSNDFRFVGLPKTSAAENVNAVHLLGYSYSPKFAALVRQENAAVGLTIKEDLDANVQNLIRRSDQWSFLEQHVPAIFLTTGLHPDYHTPQDDVGRINFEKLEKIARLAYRVTWRLATDADLPDYVDPHGRRSTH